LAAFPPPHWLPSGEQTEDPESKSNSSTLSTHRNFNCAVGGVKGGLHKTPLKSKGKLLLKGERTGEKLGKKRPLPAEDALKMRLSAR